MDWSPCPLDCGQNQGDYFQTREVKCTGDDGLTGTDNQCSETKPYVVQDCPSTSACGIKDQISMTFASSKLETMKICHKENTFIKNHYFFIFCA